MGVWQGEEERRLGRFALAGLLRWSGNPPRCSVDNQPSGNRCCSGSVDNPLCAARTPAAAWKGRQFQIQKFKLELLPRGLLHRLRKKVGSPDKITGREEGLKKETG